MRLSHRPAAARARRAAARTLAWVLVGACSPWAVALAGTATTATTATPAGVPVLITDDEARREAAAGPAPVLPTPSRGLPAPAAGQPVPRSLPGIEVLAPAADGRPVASPLRLQVAFLPPADARIVPGSFRILYGLLKLDVTERLQRHAKLSESGVVVEQAQVPQGTHRLLVRVADEKGRVAEQALVIRVDPAR